MTAWLLLEVPGGDALLQEPWDLSHLEAMWSWCPLGPRSEAFPVPEDLAFYLNIPISKLCISKFKCSQLLAEENALSSEPPPDASVLTMEIVRKQTQAGSPRVSCNLPAGQPLTGAGAKLW